MTQTCNIAPVESAPWSETPQCPLLKGKSNKETNVRQRAGLCDAVSHMFLMLRGGLKFEK